MSDYPQGPGWWQASDDKWYPPPQPEMPGGGPDHSGQVAPGAPPGNPSGPYDPAGMPPGSYGTMPPGPQSNRTPVFIGAGIAGAAVLLLGLFLILDSGGDDSGGDAQTVGDTSDTQGGDSDPDGGADTTPPPTDDGGDDGTDNSGDDPGSDAGATGDVPSSFSTSDPIELGNDLEVVEHGFSNVPEYWDGEEVEASYGAVIENTGSSLQEDVTVVVTAKAEDGSTLGSETHELYIVEAGGTMALGGQLTGTNATFAAIAELDFSFGGSSDGGSLGSGGVEVTSVTTSDGESTTEVTFGIDNNHDYDLSYPYTTMILRDSSGGIIGGDDSIGPLPSTVPANSSSGGSLTFWTSFNEVDIDYDATEVWVYYRP